MSNFASMLGSEVERVSTARKTTSKIIDAISNASYAFWKVSVGFRIPLLGDLRVKEMDPNRRHSQ